MIYLTKSYIEVSITCTADRRIFIKRVFMGSGENKCLTVD